MSDTGWIKLHRQLRDSDLWNCEPFSKGQAWIDLLMLANHKDRNIFYENQLIEVKRGQHITSLRKLSASWKWSVNKTKRFIERLERDNMITVECIKNGTLLTVINYGFYQGERNTDGTPVNTPTEQERNTDEYTYGTPTNTPTELNKNIKNIKNEKNVKNEKKEDGRKRFTPPTLDQVSEYCEERGNDVDPERFINFYESKGWVVGKSPMKDWKAAVRNWEGRDRASPKKDGMAETLLKMMEEEDDKAGCYQNDIYYPSSLPTGIPELRGNGNTEND